MLSPGLELCVDSGAYSAFTQKKEVNLDEYCTFVKKYEDIITKVVNLDVIDPEGPDIAAAAGWKNLLYMREKGINAMPVFHAREKILYLDQMLDVTDYIGLSGTSLVSPSEHIAWYHLIWDYVTDKKGYPIAKFHAFGDTSVYSLTNFPWFSVDSATWMIQGSRAARVKLQGKSYQLRSTSIRDTSYIDVNDAAPKREAWEYEFRELGINPEVILSVKTTATQMAMIRSYLVAADLLKLQEQTAGVTRYRSKSSLVNTNTREKNGVERVGPTKLYFVISPSAWMFNFPVIASLGIKNILVSYFYVATAPKAFWEEVMIPFLADPLRFCQETPKVNVFWDKLQEVLYKPAVTV